MKIAIVDKQTLQVLNYYDADAPNQAGYGGPWGDSSKTSHVALNSMDIRAVSFERSGDAIIAHEDADLKAQFQHEDAVETTQKAVAAAIVFGNKLMTEFAAENVILGITQDGKTGEVLDKMASVMVALQSGSLYEAITRAKAIDPADYDAKYVTHDRLYAFINKLEAYLGLQLSL